MYWPSGYWMSVDDHHDAACDHDDDYYDHDARARAVHNYNLMIHRVSNDDVDDTESLSYHQVNHRDDVTLTLPTPGESDHG